MINEESLLRLLIDINTQTKHTIIYRFWGHVDTIDITFFKDGWNENKGADKTFTFKFNDYEKIKEIYDYFEEILKRDSFLGFDKECGF